LNFSYFFSVLPHLRRTLSKVNARRATNEPPSERFAKPKCRAKYRGPTGILGLVLLPIEVTSTQVMLGQSIYQTLSGGNVIALHVKILGYSTINGELQTSYEIQMGESSGHGEFISGDTTSGMTQAGVVTSAGFSNSDVEIECKPISL
jgi:hypothetical protein